MAATVTEASANVKRMEPARRKCLLREETDTEMLAAISRDNEGTQLTVVM